MLSLKRVYTPRARVCECKFSYGAHSYHIYAVPTIRLNQYSDTIFLVWFCYLWNAYNLNELDFYRMDYYIQSILVWWRCLLVIGWSWFNIDTNFTCLELLTQEPNQPQQKKKSWLEHQAATAGILNSSKQHNLVYMSFIW